MKIQDNYVDNLFTLTWEWLKSGLLHIKTYLQWKNNIHEQLHVFHVAWTNGKGSVSQMISQVLRKACNKKVWLFTSPHLVHISERIQINGRPIPNDTLNTLIWKIYEETKDFFSFSYFEILTLVAIEYFLQEEVDYCVWEVWLGGTLDSTNIRSSPVATYITSIGLDHKSLLWPSLAQIQWNKMWIMKSGVPMYTNVNNKLMYEWARRKDAKLCIVEQSMSTSLLWEHQKKNAWLVYQSLVDLWFSNKQVRAWLLQVEHPWRLQYIRPNILLDGAHNVQWLQALGTYIASIRPQWKKIITVFGTSKKSNEVEDFADLLLAWDENYLVQPSVFRWLDPDEYIHKVDITHIVIEKKPEQALKQILDYIDDDTLLLIYWSLYLLGEVYEQIQN